MSTKIENKHLPRYCKKCCDVTERYASGICKNCSKKYDATPNRKAKQAARNATSEAKSYDAARNATEQRKEYRKEYNSRPEVKELSRKYNLTLARKEYISKYRAEYRKSQKGKETESAYRATKKRKESQLIHQANRIARQKMSAGDLSKGLFDKLMILQKGKCACCRADLKKVKTHLDHIMPIAKGGSNTDNNIQLLCQPCNNRKSAKHPIDFMQSRGFLL